MWVRFPPGTILGPPKAKPRSYPKRLASSRGFTLARTLSEVVMPPEFYQVGRPGNLRWDDIGLKALARDWAAWPGSPSEDLMNRSQFNLFRDIGLYLYGNSSEA